MSGSMRRMRRARLAALTGAVAHADGAATGDGRFGGAVAGGV